MILLWNNKNEVQKSSPNISVLEATQIPEKARSAVQKNIWYFHDFIIDIWETTNQHKRRFSLLQIVPKVGKEKNYELNWG